MKPCSKLFVRGLCLVGAFSLADLRPSAAAFGQTEEQARPKYVFLFIGDGMGPTQVQAADRARQETENEQLRMTRLPVSGEVITTNVDGNVTDSAAAATSLAAGVKTKNGMIGQLPDGEPVRSLSNWFVEAGWKVGVLSSVYVDHATPAAFYSHVASRSMAVEIGSQFAASGVHLLAGSSLISEAEEKNDTVTNSWRDSDEIELVRSFDQAAAVPADTRLVLLAGSLAQAQPGKGDLADTVTLAIERFKDADGFFLSVEGGAIDWRGHSNLAWENIQETLAFDRAIDVAYSFYEAHPDETLIVITADHETGGMGLVESSWDLAKLEAAPQQSSNMGAALTKDPEAITLAVVEQAIAEHFGITELTDDEKSKLTAAVEANANQRRGRVLRTAHTLAQGRAGVTWSTGGHTGQNVPVYAIGAGAEQFDGTYHNSEIPLRILKLALPEATPAAPAAAQILPAAQ